MSSSTSKTSESTPINVKYDINNKRHEAKPSNGGHLETCPPSWFQITFWGGSPSKFNFITLIYHHAKGDLLIIICSFVSPSTPTIALNVTVIISLFMAQSAVKTARPSVDDKITSDISRTKENFMSTGPSGKKQII